MEFGEDLSIILKRLCARLKESGLPFRLAGGWAVSMMGIARTTIDIDILMVLDETVKERVVSILEKSFRLIQSHDNDMEMKSVTIWRNVVTLNGNSDLFMIDILKADNDYLKNVVSRGLEIDYDGVAIPVVAIEDLIILKLLSFRKQDQVDIENLIQGETPIDWDYLEKHIETFQLNRDFIEALKAQ